MKKSKLIKELRLNMSECLEIALEETGSYSDREVLDLYTTCSECGTPMVGRKELKAAIRQADCVVEFLRLCGWSVCKDRKDESPPSTNGHPTLN